MFLHMGEYLLWDYFHVMYIFHTYCKFCSKITELIFTLVRVAASVSAFSTKWDFQIKKKFLSVLQIGKNLENDLTFILLYYYSSASFYMLFILPTPLWTIDYSPSPWSVCFFITASALNEHPFQLNAGPVFSSLLLTSGPACGALLHWRF